MDACSIHFVLEFLCVPKKFRPIPSLMAWPMQNRKQREEGKKIEIEKRNNLFISFSSTWIIARAHIYLCLVSSFLVFTELKKKNRTVSEAVAKRINFGRTVLVRHTKESWTADTQNVGVLVYTFSIWNWFLVARARSLRVLQRFRYLSFIDSFIHFVHSEHIYSFYSISIYVAL